LKFRRFDVRTDNFPRTFSAPAIHVIQDRENLSDVYGEAFARQVDLDKWFVVGVHRGLCRSGGYAVRICDIARGSDAVEVTVHFRDPQPGELVTLVMTEPYDVVFVSREGLRPGETLEFRFRDQNGDEIGRRTVTISQPGG
jgi:hypothetical protein